MNPSNYANPLWFTALSLVFVLGCGPRPIEISADRISADRISSDRAAGTGGMAGDSSNGSRVQSSESQPQSASSSDTSSDASSVSAVALVQRIASVLERERVGRRMSTQTNAAWQIFHGIIPYGFQLPIETPDRGDVSALEYAFTGGTINGFEIQGSATTLPLTNRQGIKARLEPGSYVGQGHPDQWLAICAMANIPKDTRIELGAKTLTINDWARQAQFDVPNNPVDEFSWTLIALSHYFPDEPGWRAAGDQSMSWELLVEAELTYDLNDSACGGTHRLAGVVRAVQAKERLGLPDSRVWNAAKDAIAEQIKIAEEGRAAGGALSSYYFIRPGGSVDLSAELASSGHLFEFLSLALPRERLSEPWVERAAVRLCEVLDSTQSVELDCGSLYHALNGLKIYADRLAGPAS